jgi:hypothetical protein
MRATRILFLAGMVLAFVVDSSSADEITLPADLAAMVTDQSDSKTRVALSFDVNQLPTGEGRVIDEAYLEWDLTGIPNDVTSTFELHEALVQWVPQDGSVHSTAVSGILAAEWIITPRDYEANGGFVRLDVTDLARRWCQEANNGVVLSTSALPSSSIASQLAAVQLRIRYAFVKE